MDLPAEPSEISGETSAAGAGGHTNDVEFVRGADCRDVLPLLPARVFDACITDAPYGLGMAAWDSDVPGVDVWRAIMRALKPGAFLVVFSGRRTYHRLAGAVEQAGFRIVDQAIWAFCTGRPPSRSHLRPAHEPILIARVPGPAIPLNVDAGRIPWRDAEDQARASRIDSLRAQGGRRRVYSESLARYGREPFRPNIKGRWPSTLMATDQVLGESSHIFLVPKVRDSAGHTCAKPAALIEHLVRLFAPEGGVVLDPFAGSGPMAEAAVATGRRAVLIDAAGTT